MNMFTENVKPKKRGRPPGQTPQGAAARDRLYATAMHLIAARGYEATTLRDIAKEADVSVGLLYRYFPSKQAVVIALYDELSSEFARQAGEMPAGKWICQTADMQWLWEIFLNRVPIPRIRELLNSAWKD